MQRKDWRSDFACARRFLITGRLADALGAGASTKFIFPMEFANLMKPLIGQIDQSTK